MLHILLSSGTGASPSDSSALYPGHSSLVEEERESYFSAKMQSAYSTTPAKWAEVQLVWIQNSPSPRLVCHTKVKEPGLLYYLPIPREENSRVTFLRDNSGMWNANSIIQVLNSRHQVHFLQWWPLCYECLLSR